MACGGVAGSNRTARGPSSGDNRAAPARDDRTSKQARQDSNPGLRGWSSPCCRLHHGLMRSGRPGSNGPRRAGDPVLFRLSYVRRYARLGAMLAPRCARIRKRGTTVPRDPPHRDRRACESLRQELNPHLGRTKGACLPLTLRRRDVDGDGGSRTRNRPGASGLLCHLSFIPEVDAE